MVTSFPIPGEYDGTAMLPIKSCGPSSRGEWTWWSPISGSCPRRVSGPGLRILKERPCSTFPRLAGSAGRDCGELPGSSRLTSSTPSIMAGRRGRTPPAAAMALADRLRDPLAPGR